MPVPPKPLGFVKEVIEATGHEMTYAYEDLVFVNHSAFLLQFGEKPEEVKLWVNKEESDSKVEEYIRALTPPAQERGLKILFSGRFDMEQAADEQIQIKFL